jgi:hypothetical protein
VVRSRARRSRVLHALHARHHRGVFADRQDNERAVGLGDANRLRLRSVDDAVPEEAAVDAGGLQALLTEDAGAVLEGERHDD